MNTLNIIRKQINKAAALHDAQITHTTYRGVKYDTKCVEAKDTVVSSAIVVHLTLSDRHVSTTSSRTHVPRLCGLYWHDLWRIATLA